MKTFGAFLGFFALFAVVKREVDGFSVKRRHSGGAAILFGQGRTTIQINGCDGSIKIDNSSRSPAISISRHLTKYFLTCTQVVCQLKLQFNHCATGADSENARSNETLINLAEIVGVLPKKPTGLILVNLPSANGRFIEAVKRHLKELEITIKEETETNSALLAVQNCHRLSFLSLSGPYDPNFLYEAVESKLNLHKLNIKLTSGKFDAEQTAEILAVLPELKVVNFLCRGSCVSNFSALIDEAADRISSLTGLNLQTDSQPIDSAAIKISQIVKLKTSLALVLTGNRSINCANIAEIATNLLNAEGERRLSFYLTILRVQHDCSSMENLWRRVESNLSENRSLSNCYVDGSINCSRMNGRELLISNV